MSSPTGTVAAGWPITFQGIPQAPGVRGAERAEETVSRSYAQTDAGWLADEVRAAIGRLRTSSFTARAGAHCATCPALDRLCPAPGWRE